MPPFFAPAPPCNVFRVVFSRSRAAMPGPGFEEPANQKRPRRWGRDAPPQPEIGEYWVSKGGCTGIICKGYADPPSAQKFLLGPAYRFWKGERLGLVHEVETSQQFVSIRVPHPEAENMLVWVNVWGFGYNYAYPLHNSVVESWYRRGWKDKWIFIPTPFLTYAMEGAIENNANPAG